MMWEEASAFNSFFNARAKSLRESVIELLAGSLAADGHYQVDMDVHTFPLQGFAFFTAKIRHKDEEYSLNESPMRMRGFYFDLNFN